jgi:hypothetical protein
MARRRPPVIWMWMGIAGTLLSALVAARCIADDWAGGSGSMAQPLPPLSGSPSGLQQRSIVPGPPVQPNGGARPASWPGAPSPDASWVSPSNQPAPGVAMQPCVGAQIVAHVGSEPIFEGEIISELHHMIQQLIDRNKQSMSPQEVETFRSQTLQQALQSEPAQKQALHACVQRKLICQDAKSIIPAEGWTHIEKELQKQFEDTRLEPMMKQADVSTRGDLDRKLRGQGTSLEREKRAAMERVLASQWVGEQLKRDEATPSEVQMLAYFHEHQDQFTSPARARYEELMVRYPGGKSPSREAAWAAIAQMGNRVWSGVPFAQVARESSEGATAADGGQRPWTTKGALACQAMDQALFDLRTGQLSPILESPQGFYIIRVTQREGAVVKDFRDAQVEIKGKIVQQRSDKQLKDYLAKLEAKTPVQIVDGESGNLQQARRPGEPRR